MGHQTLDGQVLDKVLARFAARRNDAVRAYRAFVEAGVVLGRQPELVEGGLRRSLATRGDDAEGDDRHRQAYDDRILGGGTFVEALWKKGAPEEAPTPTLSLEALTPRVARGQGVAAVELLRQRRLQHLSDARASICYLAVRYLGYKGVEVGRHLGLGHTGASAAARRGQDVVQRNPALLSILGPLANWLNDQRPPTPSDPYP